MKLRIKGDSLRLRLSQSEVRTFAEHRQVEDRIRFGPGSDLTYRLYIDDEAREPTASFDGAALEVRVPRSTGLTWATSDQVGIEHAARANAPNGGPRILIEKDFQCLVERPGEDESDNFPHPAGEHKTC